MREGSKKKEVKSKSKHHFWPAQFSAACECRVQRLCSALHCQSALVYGSAPLDLVDVASHKMLLLVAARVHDAEF